MQTRVIELGSVKKITYSKGRCEASFHPSILSSIRPSIWSFIHPVMICLLRRGERVEYRWGAAEKAIEMAHIPKLCNDGADG